MRGDLVSCLRVRSVASSGVLVFLFAVLWASPAAAEITIEAPDTVLEDSGFDFSVTASRPEPGVLGKTYFMSVGTSNCVDDPSRDDRADWIGYINDGNDTEIWSSDTAKIDAPGRHLLCAYVGATDNYYEVGSRELTVRQNMGQIQIEAPRVVQHGRVIAIRIFGSTEIDEQVAVRVRRDTPSGCSSSYNLISHSSLASHHFGAPGYFDETWKVRLRGRHRFLICAWLYEGIWGDRNPDAIAYRRVRTR